MQLNNFARIGKDVLIKAIGLQKNYTEVYKESELKLNENKSGCQNCPIYNMKEQMKAVGIEQAYNELHEKCKECSKAVWETSYSVSVKYINEQNRYGYQPTLKSTAIKLLLVYHFLQPDNLGFVQNVDLKELALLLGCTVTTVKSNNEILSSYGYCYVCNSGIYDNHINVLLPDYKNYHKPAKEGGRGYISMSNKMCSNLLSIKGLNTLRLNIRGIIDTDNASIHTQNQQNIISSYKQLRRFLPAYCRRNVIHGALLQDNSIFDFQFTDSSVTFQIKDQFTRKNLHDDMFANASQEMTTYIDRFNDALSKAGDDYLAGEDADTDALLHIFHINNSLRSYPPLTLTVKDLEDLTSMCVQYNNTIVMNAVAYIYNYYVAYNRKIGNFGALIRTFIRRNSSSEIAS